MRRTALRERGSRTPPPPQVARPPPDWAKPLSSGTELHDSSWHGVRRRTRCNLSNQESAHLIIAARRKSSMSKARSGCKEIIKVRSRAGRRRGNAPSLWGSGARKRPGLQPRQIERQHISQQIQKRVRPVVGASFALVRGGVRGVAGRAELVEVARHPAEAARLGDAKAAEFLLDRDRRADEVLRFAHPHGV